MIALWIGSIVLMAFILLATMFAVPEILTLLAELVSRVLRKNGGHGLSNAVEVRIALT